MFDLYKTISSTKILSVLRVQIRKQFHEFKLPQKLYQIIYRRNQIAHPVNISTFLRNIGNMQSKQALNNEIDNFIEILNINDRLTEEEKQEVYYSIFGLLEETNLYKDKNYIEVLTELKQSFMKKQANC